MSIYNDLVLEHFDHPRHAGQFTAEQDCLQGTAGQAGGGDIVQIQLQIHDGTISDARFLAEGTVALIASASYACEQLVGQPVSALAAFDSVGLVQVLDLPPQRQAAARLVADAIRSVNKILWSMRVSALMRRMFNS